MTGSLAAVLAVVFAALLLVALLVVGSLGRRAGQPTVADRIARYGPAHQRSSARAAEREGRVARAAVGWTERVLRSSKSEPKLARRLDLAGSARHPAEWVLLGACGCVVLAAVVTSLTGSLFLGVVLGVLIGWLGMRLTLSMRIGRRRAAFDEQLPNVLQLVVGSIQTGFSLSQALDAVVRDEEQPAAAEFSRALGEARLGGDLADALDGVAERMGSADLRWVVMAIRIQREVGGNLAEVLRNTIGTMRERAFLRRQVRSLSAEGRLSAYILVALPIVIGAWLLFSSGSYMRPLYTTGIGLIMLTVAVLLVIVGALWMRVLIRVKA